jgi:hypothetical protein
MKNLTYDLGLLKVWKSMKYFLIKASSSPILQSDLFALLQFLFTFE